MKLGKRYLLAGIFSVMSCMALHPSQAVAATFTVDSNGTQNDAAIDGTCATSVGTCTLRAAIQEANNAAGTIILFDDQYIINDCSLPDLTAGNTTINAYDQWDTINDRPGVKLSCTVTGILLTVNSSGNHIYGLHFLGSSPGSTGIKISAGSNNTIGTDVERRRNVLVVNGFGVENVSSGTNNTISSNYFGTEDGEHDVGITGTYGIRSSGPGNTITKNLICNQSQAGIYLNGINNTVDQNIIGLDINKQNAMSANTGIVMEFASGNDISSNTIGGNDEYGIHLGITTADNDIHHNEISAYWTTLIDLGNQIYGIYITSTGANTIRKNYIVDNKGSGIYDQSSTGSTINENIISDNEGSGIYAQGSTALTIKGNTISVNQLHGVHFGQAATGTIGGGNTSSLRNSIFTNGQHGIYLEGSSSVTVSGNLIGQDYTGANKGNSKCGIVLDSGANTNIIGGNSDAEANWIAWNDESGILLSGATTMNNTVKNNILGAPTGFRWQAGNKQSGIALSGGTHDNTIGGVGSGNTVLASGQNGIVVFLSDNNILSGNKIGTDGTHNWGNTNSGIYVWGEGNVIYANEVAYNSPSSSAYDGIRIFDATSINNKISENSIHDNGGVGINLMGGANGLISPPVLTRKGRTVIGTTCANCTVEIFSDAQDEGQYFEGSVVADGSGNFSWSGDYQGRFITATATDSALNTSMFSSAISAAFPWVMFIPATLGW